MKITEGGLTERQRRILDMVAEGHSHDEVAKGLKLTTGVVKMELRNVRKKLSVPNTAAAVFLVGRQIGMRDAAWMNDKGVIPVPCTPEEEEQNWATERLSRELRETAAKLIP